MELLELIVKNFGKLSGRSWEFEKGINIIYGENESGKTTLHTFIKSMLFGMERGRGRASLKDDFSQYEPWDNPGYYAGILRFECGGKTFRLERHFDKYSKMASLICEDDGEEFSLEKGDLEMLLDGLTVDGYMNTVSVGQLKVEVNQSLASKIEDYATNYYATGNDEIHLENAIAYLKKKKKDIDRKFKEDMLARDRKKEMINQESAYVWRDVHKIEQKIDVLDEKIKIQTSKKKKREPEPRWRVHPLEIISLFILLIAIFLLIRRPWNFLILIVTALAEGIFIWNRLKDGKRKKNDLIDPQKNIEKLLWEKEHLQAELQEKQIFQGNLTEMLEEADEKSDQNKEWEKEQKAIDFSIERLTELSAQMQINLGTKLNERASEILEYITDGKYNHLIVDKTMKMFLMTADGKISVERVSRGTIEQIYFSIRMAAVELLYEEEFPVILDDTFVFYDDHRLENILKWLSENKKQVILFTCQRREIEAAERLNLPFHKYEWV